MKKTFKWAVLTALFAGLVFSSCSNDLASDNAYYANTKVSKETASVKTIKLSATSDEGVIQFTSSASKSSRTILPDQMDGSNLDFYLGSKAKGESSYTYTKVGFTADDSDATGCTGSVTKNFELASYEFKLYAVKQGTTISKVGSSTTDYTESEIRSNAIFAGYAAADLRYNETVKFYLSANSLTGNGTVSVEITTDWDGGIPSDYTVNVGLYDFTTDELKYPSTLGSLTPTGTPSQLAATGDKAFTAGGANIAAGSYNVKVIFTNSTNGKVYVYSEKLIVLPNRKSSGTIEVPEIIGRSPTQPADLIVAYKDPDAVDSNQYEATFAWTDTSNNETSFEFELLQVDDSGTNLSYPVQPTSDTEWAAITYDTKLSCTSTILDKLSLSTSTIAISNTSSGKDSDTSNGSSLNANNNHINLLLSLEHRYFARIRAKNDDYNTDWTYANLHPTASEGKYKTAGCTKNTDITVGSSTITPSVTTTAYEIPSGYKVFDDDVASMNRYRITYNLAGGVFTDTAASGTLTGTALPATIVYESQHNTDATTATVSTTQVELLYPANHPNTTEAASDAVSGKKSTYIDQTGTKHTDIELQLKNEDTDFYWEKWVKEAVDGTDYPATSGKPDIYTGYTNLTLFASYTEISKYTDVTADVTIEDVRNYELDRSDIGVSFADSSSVVNTEIGLPADATFDDAESGKTLVFVKGVATKITFTVDNTNKYDSMRIRVQKINGKSNPKIRDSAIEVPSSGNATYTLDISSYASYSYIITIIAEKNNVSYEQKMTIRLTDE